MSAQIKTTQTLSPVYKQSQQGQHQPIRMVKVELTQPFGTISAYDSNANIRYSHAWVPVSLDGCPMGVLTVELPERGLQADKLLDQIWSHLGTGIVQQIHLNQSVQPIKRYKPRGLTVRKKSTSGKQDPVRFSTEQLCTL